MKPFHAFGSLAFFTLLSRMSGFVRVAIFAAFFGTGREADVFLGAMIIPELTYRFMSDGLVSSASIPLFVKNSGNTRSANETFWTLFWGLSIFSVIIMSFMIAGSSSICGFLVPGFLSSSREKMVVLWKILTPYILFSAQSALITAFLNANGQFAKPAVGPLFVNIFIIGGILLLYDSPIENLGFAVIFGAAVQLIWLFCLLFSSGISAKNAFSRETFKSEIFMVFLKQTAPVAMWIFLTPIVPLFERYLMSLQQEGSVAILNYTDKILYLPLGVISISLANAAFPNLSLAVLEKRNVRIELLEKFLWLLVICMFPIQVLMNSCSLEISQIIYQRGQFGELESRLTTDLLSAYSWSLIPVSGTLLLNRLFFAAGQFKIPFFAGLVTILLQLSADAFLVPRFGPIGIGWGASIASIFQTTALLAILGFKSGTGVAWYCAKPLFLALILAEGFNLVLPGFFYQLFVFLPSGKMGSLLALSASWVLFQTFSILFFRYGLPRTKSCEV